MRAHVIKDGVVINTIEIDSLNAFPDLVAATEGGIGWHYQDGKFIAPAAEPSEIPLSVSMRQARLALLAAGKLDGAEASIKGIADPAQSQSAHIEWEYASEVRRNSALVSTIGAALGMTASELDALFIDAGAR